MKTKRNNFLLHPFLYYISKTFLLWPLNADRHFRKQRKSNVVAFLNVSATLAIFFSFVYITNFTIDQNGISLNSIAFDSGWLDMYICIFNQFVGVMLSCANANRIERFFENISSVDQNLITLRGRAYPARRTNLFAIYGIAFLTSKAVVTFGPDLVFFFKQKSVMFRSICYFVVISNDIIRLQFLAFVYLLTERIDQVNRHLNGIRTIKTATIIDVTPSSRQKRHHNRARYLNDVLLIYDDLRRLADDVDAIYSFQNLFAISWSFIVCVNQLFYCQIVVDAYFRGKRKGFIPDLYLGLQWIVLHLAELLTIVFACQSVCKKFKTTTSLLHEIHNEAEFGEVNFQLKLFIQRDMQKRIKFTACNLFTIDSKLILKMCGTIITYLIVMIQLNGGKYYGT